MSSHADRLVERWVHDPNDCPSLDEWAKEIDARCRVEGFLHTSRKRIVFSDGSAVVLANNCLSKEK